MFKLFKKKSATSRERVKFFILTRYRSGSNLLNETIRSIKDVKAYYEAFNHVYIVKNPSEYLDHQLVNKMFHDVDPNGIKAIGFKLMYGQAMREELDESYWGQGINTQVRDQIISINDFLEKENLNKNAFEHLLDQVVKDKEIRIIHLVRKNQLDSYVSMRLAMKENNWHSKTYDITGGDIEVDSNDLLKYFIRGESYYCNYKELFKDHPMMEISYQELTTDYQQTIRKAFDFLSLNNEKIPERPPLRKQNIYKNSEIIKNYDVIYDHFKDTIWGDYFRDDSLYNK